jgi:single-stranded DNA-binding protein
MGRNQQVGYINVSVFGNGGEAAAKHLTKGWLLAIDVRIEFDEWNSKDGKRHDYSVVGNVEFLPAPRVSEEAVAA